MKTTKIIRTGGESRVKELRTQIERDPLNVNLRLMLASQLEGGGKLGEAIRELETAVAKARRNLGVAYCNYAVTLMHANQPETALQHFDTAVEVDPANASFYLSNKAHALSKIGLNDKAKAIYEQVLHQPNVSKETRRIVIQNLKDVK